MYSSTLSLTLLLDGVVGQRDALAASTLGITRYPPYRRLGRPHGRSERTRKILPPSGFDPRTVQTIASGYNAYAIPAHTLAFLYV